jgi:hypothetical protein
MAQLILHCGKTDRAFKTDFQARADLGNVPRKWKATLLCAMCHRVHEFDFAAARVCECPNFCSRQFGQCQNCEFAIRTTVTAG